MTEAQLREIWKKTNGHCHFCGDRISLRKRGYRRQRADGCWEVDHVIQRDKNGKDSLANYLPACTSCNRLRWHRTGAELRRMLELGRLAKREIDLLTVTGKRLIRLEDEHVKRKRNRRDGQSLPITNSVDPVLRAQVRHRQREILTSFLQRNLGQSFSAAELSNHTRVAKILIRALLVGSHKVSVIGNGGRYIFQSRRPKRKRRKFKED